MARAVTIRKMSRIFRAVTTFTMLLLLCVGCARAVQLKPALSVSLDGANRIIEMGRSFDITLTITNTGAQETIVEEIRLPAGILKAFRYLGSLPAVTLEPLADGSGVLRTQLIIPPGGSAQFILRFASVYSGIYEEEFSVLTEDQRIPLPARVEVRGSIPAGWQPGAAAPRGQSEPAAGLPTSAVVRVGALVDVGGTLVKAWSASGVIISRDGLILTSARAVLGSRFYPVSDLIIGLQTAPNTLPVDAYLASIVQVDEARDAALIKPRSDLLGNLIAPGTLSLPALPLADNPSVAVGETLSLIGYGQNAEALSRVLPGAVLGLSPEDGSAPIETILMELPAGGDYFGWAALNSRGEVVGLASAPTTAGGLECGALADTNRDGIVDDTDHCLPAGGNLGALTSLQALDGMLTEGWMGELGLQRVSVLDLPFVVEGKSVFQADFSAGTPGWKSTEMPGTQSAYEDEALALTISEPRRLLFSTLDYAYDQLTISADARLNAGGGDGSFGLVCAFRDANHFIALEVSEDGYFSIWKRAGTETTYLIDWTYADAFDPSQSLHLTAQCGANGLKLAVNDRLLGGTIDPDFSVGLVGIMAGTYEGSLLKATFDNVEIFIPGDE